MSYGPISSLPISSLPATAAAAPAQSPLSKPHWPNPRGAVPCVDLLTWVLGFSVLLQQPVQAPFSQTAWDVPAAPAARVELRTWIDRTKINLIGQDAFFGLAGNPNFDWPNPRGATPAIDLRSWLQGVNYPLSLVVVYPTFNYDWPNPRGPIITLKTWTDPVKIQLIGQDRIYGDPGLVPSFDWPNPYGYTPGTSLKTWIDQSKLNLIGQDTFFGLAGNPTMDWPVPGGARPSVTLRTWADSNFLNLTTIPTITETLMGQACL